MAKVLSVTDLEYMNRDLSEFSNRMNEEITNFRKVISMFNNEQIVKSFYSSGAFGQENKERLDQLLDALLRFNNAINDEDGLVNGTKEFIKLQMDQNNKNVSRS